MKNIYCAHLNFDIDTSPLEKIKQSCNKTELMILEYPRVDENLKHFLKQFQIVISRAEVFHTPAKAKLPIHVDMEEFSNIVKLNWVIGGGEMVWWKPKDNTVLRHHTTPIGTKYLLFDESECNEVYRQKVGWPSLVNAGVPHSVDNHTDESRWCISHNIHCSITGEQLQWQDAIKRFAEVAQW